MSFLITPRREVRGCSRRVRVVRIVSYESSRHGIGRKLLFVHRKVLFFSDPLAVMPGYVPVVFLLPWGSVSVREIIVVIVTQVRDEYGQI